MRENRKGLEKDSFERDMIGGMALDEIGQDRIAYNRVGCDKIWYDRT